MTKIDVQDLRSSLTANNARWSAGETSMTSLSPEEQRLRLGAEPPAGKASLADREKRASANLTSRAAASTAPAAWDWRAVGGADYLGAPRDQKSCGSCVSFGTVAAIEGTTRVAAKQPGLDIDLSEAHLFYCHGASEGRNCGNGWWPDQALAAAKAKGIVDEACFPYVAGDQACKTCSDAATRLTKIKSFKSLTTAADMKAWLAEKGPVVGCFTVYEDFYAYQSGVYHHVSGRQVGGHCICVVGYSDIDKAWICRNSWGPGWAENGYFRIGYGEVGIDAEMWGVETDARPVVDDKTNLENALITGLWVNARASGAQAYVDKLGWRKLTTPEFVTAAAAAKVAKSKCTLSISGDTITELYVL